MKLLVIFVSLLTIASCGSQKSGDSGGSDQPQVTISLMGESDTPIAEINGVAITEKELNQRIGKQLVRVKNQIFDIQRQGINALINEKILEEEAKKQGVSVQALIKQNVSDKVGEVTDKEVEDFYGKNKPRFRGKTLEQVKGKVKQQLLARKSSVFRNNYLDRLKDNSKIKVFLSRPTIDVSVDDDPMLGNKNAKVTIIEFTDYQCPFCSRVRPTIKQIMDQYGNKVRYVLRDFPLNFHPQAKKAAEAATCAGDQDKYWDYSKILWANQRALDIPQLKKYAKQTGLDQTKFDECLDSNKYSAEVAKDMADGSKAGVTGTPSFFINGQMLTGARPYEQFKEIIDLELRSGS